MKDTDKRLHGTLHDFQHFPFPALTVRLFLCHSHSDGVAVQCTPCLGGLHENVILFPVHYDECIAFPRHLDPADELRQHSFFLFLLFTAFLAPVSVPTCHDIE